MPARSTGWIDHLAWLGVLLSLLVAVGEGRAEPDPDRVRRAQAIAEQGIAAYDRKEYGDAIQLFEEAYRLAPATALLYNIAQAYRMLGDSGCETALRYYERYLAELETSRAAIPAGVQARIVEMKACVERRSRASAAPEPPAVTPASDPPPALTSSSPPPALDAPRDGRRTAGWIVTGVGAAATATAAVTGAIALQRESDLLDECGDEVCPEDSRLRADVRSYDRLRVTAFVSGAVGLTALATGVWLLVTSRSGEARAAGQARSRRRVAPWVGAGSIGLRGDF